MTRQRQRPAAAGVVAVLSAGFLTLPLPAQDTGTASGATGAGQPALAWRSDPAGTRRMLAEVTGLSPAVLRRLGQTNRSLEQWQALFAIYAGPDERMSDPGLPPVSGAYWVGDDSVRFLPAFPPGRGVRYRAVFRPALLPGAADSNAEPVAASLPAPVPDVRPATEVAAVYPSAAVLPENLLKFYLHFSGPMSRGHSYDHIHLRNAAGERVELPFLELDEELWDPAMTRLTLFFDPGRIKRGLRPLEENGPSLEAGGRYTLVIDREWRDAGGHPLRTPFEKTFQVGPPDREPPDPDMWMLDAPKTGTWDTLTLHFPEPMDRALATRLIRVTDAAGDPVPGEVALLDEERRWTLVPDQPWRPGRHQVVIPTTLEDLAGNNVGKPFDVDLFERVERRLTNAVVTRSFELR